MNRTSRTIRLGAVFLAVSTLAGCYRWAPLQSWQSQQEQTVHYARAHVGRGASAIDLRDAQLTGTVLSGTDASGTMMIVDTRDHDAVAVRRANWLGVAGISAGATVGIVLGGMAILVALALRSEPERPTMFTTGGAAPTRD